MSLLGGAPSPVLHLSPCCARSSSGSAGVADDTGQFQPLDRGLHGATSQYLRPRSLGVRNVERCIRELLNIVADSTLFKQIPTSSLRPGRSATLRTQPARSHLAARRFLFTAQQHCISCRHCVPRRRCCVRPVHRTVHSALRPSRTARLRGKLRSGRCSGRHILCVFYAV